MYLQKSADTCKHTVITVMQCVQKLSCVSLLLVRPWITIEKYKNKKQKYILGAINLGYPIQCEVLKGPPPSGCEVMDLWSFLRKAPKTPLKIWTEKFFEKFLKKF